MINQKMLALGKEPSAIRQLYAFGLERKAVVGDDNVYDYSIGNPSIPAPEGVRTRILELMEKSPVEVHGYSMAAGLMKTRQAVADNLSKRFGIPASAKNVFMTTGASSALAISMKALALPGEEIIVNAPFFPEYRVDIEAAGATCVEVMMTVPDFQLDIAALDDAIGPNTAAVIINSPNNPVGCIYPEDNIRALAELLARKSEQRGRPVYLISDEPYREISYGKEVPFTASFYDATIVCYSWAKSLSLPGERIGYIYVNETMPDADDVNAAVAGAGRALGYVCAPVLFQQVIQECIDLPTDVAAYAENRELLTSGLSDLGFEFVEPDGAFYLWVKALEDDAKAFSERAKAHDLLIVPSDSFGIPGWVRCSYCISPDTIRDSMVAWKALKEEYAS